MSVPDAPIITSSTMVSSSSVRIEFTLGSEGGSVITDVLYARDTDAYGTWTSLGLSSPATIIELSSPSGSYKLRAVNDNGESADSNIGVVALITAPDAPVFTSVPVMINSSSVRIEFSVASNGGSAITDIQYARDTNSYGSWVSLGLVSPATITGLSSPSGSYKLRAVNNFGESAESLEGVVALITAPDAPIITSSAMISSSSVSISFTLGSTGGSDITDVLYARDTDSYGTWVSLGLVSPATITGLSSPSGSYKLRAVNNFGESADSLEGVVALITAPDAPIITSSAMISSSSVRIEFSVASNGGSAITDIQYARDTDTYGTWTSLGLSSPATITGLTSPSGSYKLRAVNNFGESADSLEGVVALITAPDAPIITSSAMISSSSVRIEFSVASNGGSDITDIQYARDTDSYVTWTSLGLVSPATITGLSTPNGSYKLRAVNNFGESADSLEGVVALITAPDAPIITSSAMISSSSVSISFTLGSTGGSDITDVLYARDTDAYVTWTSLGLVSPATITGLSTPNGSYKLRAVNNFGESADSLEGVVALITAPDAPIITSSAMISSSSVSISFTLGSTGGSDITDVLYARDTDAYATWVSLGLVSPATITGLTTPNGSYKLRAVNIIGESAESLEGVVALITVPDAPVFSSPPTMVSETSVTFHFTLGSNGGSDLTALEYARDTDSYVAWTSLGLSLPLEGITTATITGLTSRPYGSYKLRSTNIIGPSALSLEGVIPTTVPVAPTIMFEPTLIDSTTIRVEFTLGSDGGSAITGIQYARSTDSYATWTLIAPHAPLDGCLEGYTCALISGLTAPANNGSYKFRAVNTNGPSADSLATLVNPLPVPDAPSFSSSPILVDDTTVTFNFTLGGNNGYNLTNIQYARSTDSYATWTSLGLSLPLEGQTTATVTGLTSRPYGSYKIRSVNANGNSDPSVAGVIATTVPVAPVFSSEPIMVSDTSVTFNFTLGSNGGADLTDIQYARDTDSYVAWTSLGLSLPLEDKTTATVTGLASRPYGSYKLRAVNTNGNSALSLAGVIATTIPVAPSFSSSPIMVSDTSVTFNFTLGSNGGADLSDIQYARDTDSYVAWTSLGLSLPLEDKTTATVTGLTSRPYGSYKLRAVNTNGNSAASAADLIATTVPAAPSFSSSPIMIGSSSITIQFSLGSNGGSDLTDLQYARFTDGYTTWTSVGLTLPLAGQTSATISGLASPPNGYYKLRSVNANGNSAPSVVGFVELASVPCFLECTRILCKINDVEKYVAVETIRPGTLVKTSLNGFQPVKLIGSRSMVNVGGDVRDKNSLYLCTRENYPELSGDLIITGCHSILVDQITDTHRQGIIDTLERVFVTDKKYRLPACVDERASVCQKVGTFTVWHFALEHTDIKMNYGVYAHGLLVESSPIWHMNTKNYTLVQ